MGRTYTRISILDRTPFSVVSDPEVHDRAGPTCVREQRGIEVMRRRLGQTRK